MAGATWNRYLLVSQRTGLPHRKAPGPYSWWILRRGIAARGRVREAPKGYAWALVEE